MIKYRPIIFLLIPLSIINITIIEQVIGEGKSQLFEENGLIENIQAISFLSACLITFFVYFKQTEFKKWLAAFFSLTYLTFFLREIDAKDFHASQTVEFFVSGTGKDMLISLGFIILFGYFLKYYQHLFSQIKFILRSKVAIWTLAGCMLLVTGRGFEILDLVLFEELSELNGTLLILLAALIFAKDPECLTKHCNRPLTHQDNEIPVILSD